MPLVDKTIWETLAILALPCIMRYDPIILRTEGACCELKAGWYKNKCYTYDVLNYFLLFNSIATRNSELLNSNSAATNRSIQDKQWVQPS